MRGTIRELGSRTRAWGTVGGLVDATLVKNTASLYVIQFANYLLPLITIPYLVRVLGPVNYGAVAFAQSLIGYFMVFVDYGFDLSATRKISVHRQDPATVSQIAVNTWAAKGLLCVLQFLILVVITLLIPQVREIWQLVFVLYGLVVGNVLFPVWLFQGMERMVAISIINLGMRLLVVIGMLFAVRRPEDYVVYAALLSAGAFIAGGLGLVIGVHTFGLRLVQPSMSTIWSSLVDGWLLFLANAAGTVYVLGNSFILGLLTNYTAVAHYRAGEQLVRAVVGVLSPLARAVYPRSTKIASDSRLPLLRWAMMLLLGFGSIGLLLSLVLAISATVLADLLLGPGYEPVTNVIRILSPLPFLVAVSYALGPQVTVSLGLDRIFTVALLVGALVDVILVWLTGPVWGEAGAALALLAAEVFVALAMSFCVWTIWKRHKVGRTRGLTGWT
jgi:PST family polysaccharide transporter